MIGNAEREAFVRRHTAVLSPPLCPELRLHLAPEVTPLWEATEVLEGRSGLPPPYWAFCWPGGQALARHLLDRPGEVRGLRVLDFASGCGVGAIAAALCGAGEVVAAEIDPLGGVAAGLNAALNGVQVAVRTEDLLGSDEGWDVVCAGDVCYERPMSERVERWLRRLSARGARVLLADPGRAYAPSTGLRPLSRHVVPTSVDLEDRDRRETAIFEVLTTAKSAD